MVLIKPIPAFNDNYIWLGQLEDRAFVVDPGEAAPVIQTLEEHALNLQAILVTHHHADHIGGVSELCARYPAVRVFAPQNPRILDCTDIVHDADTIHIESMSCLFKVMAIPGHTLDHVAYYAPGVLFCGDTLFSAGCGRIFEGTPEQMYHSLNRLKGLPDDTAIYCAHEYTASNIDFALSVDPENKALRAYSQSVQKLRGQGSPTLPSQLGQERLFNPFLRADNEQMMASLGIDQDPIECFRKLRSMKDVF